jgi:hypothetical protein
MAIRNSAAVEAALAAAADQAGASATGRRPRKAQKISRGSAPDSDRVKHEDGTDMLGEPVLVGGVLHMGGGDADDDEGF